MSSSAGAGTLPNARRRRHNPRSRASRAEENQPMAYTITPLTEHTGAEVRGLRSEPGRRCRDPHGAEPRFCRPSSAGDPRPGVHPAAIHCGGPGFRRAVPAMTSARCTFLATRRIYYVSNEQPCPASATSPARPSHRPLQSSDTAQGDDAVPGVAAEPRRRHPIRQHARGL